MDLGSFPSRRAGFRERRVADLGFLCLALVMVKCCKRSVELLLAAGRLFLLAPPGRDLTGSWLRGVVFANAGEQQAACLLLTFRNLPLQI